MSENPYREGPNKGNMTEQMFAVGEDPETAFKLMIAAGYHPREFGISMEKYGFDPDVEVPAKETA